jgi:hypothetical protein
MKSLAILAVFCACSFFGLSCSNSGYPYRAQTPPASAYYRPVATAATPNPIPIVESQNKRVEIISVPAGARIEVNDDYVGDAPIIVEIPQQEGYFTATTTIRALPTETGYTQTKMFFPSMGGLGDKVPSRILFDTRLGPVTPAVDVNVNPPQ